MNSTEILLLSSFKYELDNNRHLPDNARGFLEDRIGHLVKKGEDHYEGDFGEYLKLKEDLI